MKKKMTKKILKRSALIFILGFNILFFMIINPHQHTPGNTKLTEKSSTNKMISTDRSPASTLKNTQMQKVPFGTNLVKRQDTKKTALLNGREIIGPQKTPSQIVYSNSFNQKWKKTYENHFLRMVGKNKIKDFKIQTKRSIIKIQHNTGTLLEHIVVSYKKENGSPFSFEALINSETGMTVQTWNQTKYEKNHRYAVKAKASDFAYKAP